MTSRYRHRRIYNPAASLPPVIEPGEIAVNTANRQIAVGDADPTSPGSLRPLIGVRFFDAKAQYVGGEFVVQAGVLYRSKDVVLPGAFNAAQWESYVSDPVTKAYIDAADADIIADFQNADTAITNAYQAADAALTGAVNGKVSKNGDIMVGPLQLADDPETDMEAATKRYVDETVATGGTTPHADQIITVPAGGLSSGNVQLQLYELDLEKAPLASPQFTGNARAETRPVDDNSISIATTAFVLGQAGVVPPSVPGTANPGSSLHYAREDHVHPPDPNAVPAESPQFTGNPRAPTPAPGDNDTSLATTEFVQQAVLGISGFSTGDVKLTIKTTADNGWVMMNDGTIGDVSSGATARANADCHALFVLLWTNIPDTYCPVPGGRGVSAANDWTARKQITLPRALGRTLAIAGSGAGLSGRALGQFLGEENHTLVAPEVPNLNVSVSVSGSATVNAETYSGPYGAGYIPPVGELAEVEPRKGEGSTGIANQVDPYTTKAGLAGTMTGSISGSGSGATTNGGGGAHNNMQPSSFFNVMVKL